MAVRSVFKIPVNGNILTLLHHGNWNNGYRCLSTSTVRHLDVSGIFTPITTPFKQDESIAVDKLSDNLTKWNSTNLKGYLVEGSNGEVALLSAEERIQLVRRVRSMVPKEKILLAGGGCEGTDSTVRLSQQMAEAGADAVMVVTPSYYKSVLTDRALIHHYSVVADQCPVPILLYSVPANTGVDLSVAAVKVLSQHPNIIGVKDSGGDITKIASLVHATKEEGFQVLAGSAGFLLAALHVGCVGGVCALGNVAPELVCQLYELYQRVVGNVASNSTGAAGDMAELLALQQRLIGPNTAVTKSYGIAGLKQAMDWVGYYGGPTRKPLMPLNRDDCLALKNILVTADIIAKS